jgi:hypothetical protein
MTQARFSLGSIRPQVQTNPTTTVPVDAGVDSLETASEDLQIEKAAFRVYHLIQPNRQTVLFNPTISTLSPVLLDQERDPT